MRGRRLAPLVAYLGDASYSIYLAHPVVLFVLTMNLRATPRRPLLLAVETAVLCVCVGVASYELIERPIMRLARYVRGARTLRVAPA